MTFWNFSYHNFNKSLFSSIFSTDLKKNDITFIHKKRNLIIEYYCSVRSVCSTVLSKIYERFMFDQVYTYSNQILSKHQYGFRQGCSTQHSLLLMIEKFKKSLGNGGLRGMLLIDLSKVFSCLRHNLLIANRAVFGFQR